jgi:Flp pilus assembly pilin Flp
MRASITTYIRANVVRLAVGDQGQTLTEYALVVGVIALAAIGALALITGSLTGFLTLVVNALSGS